MKLTYSVVIPTKDRSELLRGALTGIAAQTRRPERIVVVDASDPPVALGGELPDAARAAGVELLVIHAPASTAGQRNRGIERVETPITLLLDDDVSLEPEYVETLLGRWERDGEEAFGAIVGVPGQMPRQGPLARVMRRLFMLHYQAQRGEATSFRRSRKLRMVLNPSHAVVVPACGAGYGLFRTDLLRRHPFDERFPGYAPGEDLDMSSRLAADAPILAVPSVRYLHAWDPRERKAPGRWHRRGRCETYFRLRHLDSSPVSRAAFGLSLVAETAVAAAESLRERDRRHVAGFVRGVAEALREHRRGS
ncbi:MAG: glycosyltransferase family 2 protein [Solirubrobacterales bacterium]